MRNLDRCHLNFIYQDIFSASCLFIHRTHIMSVKHRAFQTFHKFTTSPQPLMQIKIFACHCAVLFFNSLQCSHTFGKINMFVQLLKITVMKRLLLSPLTAINQTGSNNRNCLKSYKVLCWTHSKYFCFLYCFVKLLKAEWRTNFGQTIVELSMQKKINVCVFYEPRSLNRASAPFVNTEWNYTLLQYLVVVMQVTTSASQLCQIAVNM